MLRGGKRPGAGRLLGAISKSTRAILEAVLVADVREKHRRKMTADEQALFCIDKLNVSRSDIPAVTHVDYSARVQTVYRETNPRYHALIFAFKGLTGCGVLVNTNFNVRGEPIVCTPEDAFRCFMGSEIEVLTVGNCYLKKKEQNPALKQGYKGAFELDQRLGEGRATSASLA